MDGAERLGRYTLVRELGAGGHGAVYEAVMHGPDGFSMPVALKRLHRGDELEREARIGGLLSHPNLVDVYEIARIEGQWCCAMELCGGGTLAEAPELPPAAIVDVGLQVCAALAYAHAELGLVHRDLKPANLFLDGGVVKVGDLGIARAQGFDDDGHIRGTPAYMAPEQLRGDPVDARADVFALGVVLVELAGGQGSWGADTMDPDEEVAAEPPDVVAWLRPAVERALSPEPEDRYPTMAAFADALAALPVDGPGLRQVLGATVASPSVATLIGRVAELEALDRALAEPGMVVLHGPPGIGKSRLARAWVERRAARAHFVDLASCRTRLEAVAAIAAGLGLQLDAAQEPVEQLGAVLRHRNPLLVLDTLEHLTIDPLLAEVLRAAPSLRVLATSRSLPALPHRVVAVGPLPADDAVALLLARARRRGRVIDVGPAVQGIVERLDGVPYALELAAARIGVLDAEEVLERLDVAWLRGREQGETEQTLENALCWSWELLAPRTRTGLSELSVFRGPFTTRAARAVVSGALPIETLLAVCRDHSWLLERDGRFVWLRLARDFAERQGNTQGASERHRAWFAQLGSVASRRALTTHGGVERWQELRRDLDDLRAAAAKAIEAGAHDEALGALEAVVEVIERTGPLELADPLLDALGRRALEPREQGRLHLLRGRLALRRDGTAVDHLTQAARLLPPASWSRARALYLQASHLQRLASEVAPRRLEEVVELASRGGFSDLLSLARGAQGQLAGQQGDDDAARGFYREALAIARAEGDVWQLAIVHGNLTILHHGFGRFQQALGHLLTSAALHRQTGNLRSQGVALTNLAVVVDHRDPALSRELAVRALEIHRQVGNRRFVALTLANLGALDLAAYRWEDAHTCFAEATDLYDRLGSGRLAWQARCGLAYTEVLMRRVGVARERLERLAPGCERFPLDAYRWSVAFAALALVEGDRPAAEARIADAETWLRDRGVEEASAAWTALREFWRLEETVQAGGAAATSGLEDRRDRNP